MSNSITSDGYVVWVNDRFGICIGRFSFAGYESNHGGTSPNFGSIINSEKGPCGHADWRRFKAQMLEHHQVVVNDAHMPEYLKQRAEAI